MFKKRNKTALLILTLLTVTLIVSGCDMGSSTDDGIDETPETTHQLRVTTEEPYVSSDDNEFGMTGVDEAGVILEGSSEKTETTDADGTAVFSDLEEGEYTLTTLREEYEEVSRSLKIEESSGESAIFSEEIELRKENSAELEDEAQFNRRDPGDVHVDIEWNEAKVGQLKLFWEMAEEDYDVGEESWLMSEDSGTLIIREDVFRDADGEYREAGTEIEFFAEFDYGKDEGSDGRLKVEIIEEEIQTDPELDPAELTLDLEEPEDIETDIIWNEASSVESIRLEVDEDDYEVKGNDESLADVDYDNDKLIIYYDRLKDVRDLQDGDELEFTVSFDKGENFQLLVNVVEEDEDEDDPEPEPEPEPGEINVSGEFDIQHSFPHSEVEMNGEAEAETGEEWDVESSELEAFEQERSNEMIIRFHRSISEDEARTKAFEMGQTPIDYMPELNAMLVELPSQAKPAEMMAQAAGKASVKSASPNNVFTISDYREPDDNHYDRQWAPSTMRLPQTWRDVTGSNRVRLAVLDTGIDYTHGDLDGLVDKDSGYNFTTDDEDDFMDRQGHGTHVAGISGALGDNEYGVAGVMWDVELLPVKVLSDSGMGSEWQVAEGILHAAGLNEESPVEPADVMNMSLGMHSDETPEVMEEAVEKAAAEGVLMIAASGNSGERDVGYPAKFEDVVAVGALSESESGPPEIAHYSSYGPEIELAAPGTDVWSLYPEEQVAVMSGTSMAAPQVAGLAGLMISEGIPHSEVIDLMKETAFDLGDPGYNEYYGHGMINTYWASHEAAEINFLVGERDGRSFEIVAESSADLSEEEFTIEDVPSGEYEVMAWLDVRGSGDLENGDYFASTGTVTLEEGVYEFDLTLEELNF